MRGQGARQVHRIGGEAPLPVPHRGGGRRSPQGRDRPGRRGRARDLLRGDDDVRHARRISCHPTRRPPSARTGSQSRSSKLAGAQIGCHIKMAKTAFARKPFDEEAREEKAQGNTTRRRRSASAARFVSTPRRSRARSARPSTTRTARSTARSEGRQRCVGGGFGPGARIASSSSFPAQSSSILALVVITVVV